MNGDKLRLWVDALRSGDYHQTSGKLRSTDDRYCCLGVLCDVARKDGVKMKIELFDYSGSTTGIAYDGYSTFPPPAVINWLGHEGPSIYVPWPEELSDPKPSHRDVISVVSLNDRYGWDFHQIADAVEAHYLKNEVSA